MSNSKRYFKSDNLNDLYIDVVNEVVNNPEFIAAPRGMSIKEITNVNVILTNPCNSIVTLNTRKMNHAFSIIEKLEYLSGQSNPERLKFYNKNLEPFLNKYNMQDGNYPDRLNYWMRYIYNLLKKDPDSRQAIATIYGPQDRHETKDVPCLAGETIMTSPEGNIEIQVLYKKFKTKKITKYPVFTFNEKTREIEIQYCTNVWKTGRKKLLKITFDDNSIIRITPNHRVYRKVRKHILDDVKHSSRTIIDIVEANKLQEGDKIWATHFLQATHQNRPLFIKNLSDCWHYHNQASVCREYDIFLNHSKLPKNNVVHHIDGDVNNNSRKNIIRMLKNKHNALNMFGKDNPMHNETTEQNLKRRLKLRQTWKKKGYRVKPINEYHTNHVIRKIEEDDVDSVYDFTCENNHNAVVGTGVIVHNCTVMHHYMIRNGRLNLTVYMRSNDLLWGFPYDVSAFCFLQQAMAAMLNVGIGTYTHIAGSLHSYDSKENELTSILKDSSEKEYFNCLINSCTFDEMIQNINLFWVIENQYRTNFQVTKEMFPLDSELPMFLIEALSVVHKYITKKFAIQQ